MNIRKGPATREITLILSSYPFEMTQTVFRYLAWASILGLFIVTDTTQAFRPLTLVSPSIDRFVALFFVGAIFSFAYPKHRLQIVFVLVAVVIGFELLQRLLAGRHGYVKDMFVKGAGCCAGVAATAALQRALALFSKRTPP